MANPNIPMVNLGTRYLQGCRLTYATTTTFTIGAGQARDSTNVNDIRFPDTVTVSLGTSGLNGIDTGTVAASNLYYVHVVGNSNGNPDAPASGAVLSLSATAPVLPAGYDMFRRIGAIRVNGSSQVSLFTQQATHSNNRYMWYDANVSIVAAATDATFTASSMAGYIPSIPGGLNAILQMNVTPTAAGNSGALRPTGSASTNGYVIVSGSVAAVVQQAQVVCPVSALASVDYKVTGTITVLIAGYIDQL